MEERLWHLLVETDGGPNRARIIRALDRSPGNANQLAVRLDVNYNTVRYHLRVLRDHGIVESSGARYGEVHDLTEQFYQHWHTFVRIADHVE